MWRLNRAAILLFFIQAKIHKSSKLNQSFEIVSQLHLSIFLYFENNESTLSDELEEIRNRF